MAVMLVLSAIASFGPKAVELIGRFAAGMPSEAQDAIERFQAIDGVDAVTLAFPRKATPPKIKETMAAMAPTG